MIDSLQIAFFTKAVIPDLAAALFSAHSGTPPDGQSSTTNGSSNAFKIVNDHILTLQVGPNVPTGTTVGYGPSSRIDIFVMKDPSKAQLSRSIDLATAISAVLALAEGVAAFVDCTRIAVVTQYSEEQASAAAATSELSKMMGGIAIPSGAEEIFFQFNKPCPSKSIPGASLVRLVRWQTALLAVAQAGPNGIFANSAAAKDAVFIYYDVSNASQNRGFLPSTSLGFQVQKDLLNEILNEVQELDRNGFKRVA